MTQRQPRPCSAAEAVQRAAMLVDDLRMGNAGHGYVWGGGSYRSDAPDVPWTTNAFGTGCDCYGLVTWAYKTPRHREGLNRGPWSSVADDGNCDSAIEDAEHEMDLWRPVYDGPRPGDILVWPTLHKPGLRIGHVSLIEHVSRCAEWDWAQPSYELLDVIQVCGPENRKPAAIRSNGAQWHGRERFMGQTDQRWRTRVLRSVG